MIVAVNSGEYETMPEWSQGRRNKDLICEVCGNLEPSAVIPDGTMCGFDRKETAIISSIRKRYIPQCDEIHSHDIRKEYPHEKINPDKCRSYSNSENEEHYPSNHCERFRG